MPKYYLVPSEILFHNNMSKGYIEDLIKNNEVKSFEIEQPIKECTLISTTNYHKLLDKSFKLNCLENGGVDNWNFYDEAMKAYHLANDEEE